MKKIIIIFVLFCCIPSVDIFAQSWTLVWHDEFNDTAINRRNWTFDTGGNGWGNNEMEYYTGRPQNATVYNGNLLIIARKEHFDTNEYTSARLKTHGLQRWTYGKIEARIKLPCQQGLWPAFWMLGDSINKVGFPFCGELDIMECVNTEHVIHGTMHWASDSELVNCGGAIRVKNMNEYHIYSVEWDTNSIKWYVDTTLYWEGLIGNNLNQTGAFHKPFFILLNMAIGGDWPGNPTGETNFPDTMYVDYVRVYQMNPAGAR